MAVLRLHAAVSWLRNEGIIRLCKASVCAPGHKARQSTKKAPNFRDLRHCEVRRIPPS